MCVQSLQCESEAARGEGEGILFFLPAIFAVWFEERNRYIFAQITCLPGMAKSTGGRVAGKCAAKHGRVAAERNGGATQSLANVFFPQKLTSPSHSFFCKFYVC